MQASPRAGSARPTARPVQRPGSARPRGAENRQLVERFSVSPRMHPDELPNFGLNFHPKYPERRPQTNNSPRSPRLSPRNAPPKPAPLTTARIQEPHGFEPAGYKQPWGGLPDAKFPPWMRYGAQCTMKQRPTSAHAMNKEPAEFHKAVMQEFVDAAHADGEIDDAERKALTTARERDLEWTKYTPEQLAARNKKRTLESDVFHRKPAHERSSNPNPKP